MTLIASALRVLRFVVFLTLFSLLTVLLIVPTLLLVFIALTLLLAVLALALPFAAVGFLLWCPYFALSRDRRAVWARLRFRARKFGGWLVAVPLTGCVRLGTWGIRVGRTLVPKALPVVRRAGAPPNPIRSPADMAQRRPARSQFRGGAVWEMIAGAAVGTILVCLIDSTEPGLAVGLHLLGGAAAGTMLGLLIARAQCHR